MLWGRSGSLCAICRRQLVIDSSDSDDDESIVGDMAHIVARKNTFTRGDYDSLPVEARDKYPNLILLCKVHHKQIDDQPAYYTVEELCAIKRSHEQWVRSRLSGTEVKAQEVDELYGGYVQEICQRLAVSNWRRISFFVCCADGPMMEVEYRNRLSEIGPWVISRYWPHTDLELEGAFFNCKNVLEDFLNVFCKYSETTGKDNSFLKTREFYKGEWVEEAEFKRRLKTYEDHVALVNDLFFELTRAVNYLFDKVRIVLLPSFRTKDGVLLIEQDRAGPSLENKATRVEYRGAERTERPYPGLNEFLTVRFSRDYYTIPYSD